MNGSGDHKSRIREARAQLEAFYASRERKIIFDIDGLSHKEVSKILYGGLFSRLGMMVRYWIALALYSFPASGIKTWFYRRCGVSIGKEVYISPSVYFDAINPSLITIGDRVMIGMGAKFVVHERTMKKLSVGRINIGNDVTLGGMAIVRHAVTIGDRAEIDMMCIVGRSVPSDTKLVTTRSGIRLYAKNL
jgi:acetyltransferase-like isoleucine patch superfamily enzyme